MGEAGKSQDVKLNLDFLPELTLRIRQNKRLGGEEEICKKTLKRINLARCLKM